MRLSSSAIPLCMLWFHLPACQYGRSSTRCAAKATLVRSAGGATRLWCAVQEVYVFAYGFSLEKGVKCMQQDVAIAMWRLIFSAQPWPLLNAWWVDVLQGSLHAALEGYGSGLVRTTFLHPMQGDAYMHRCDFLEQHHNRAVSKDTWMQLLDFSRVRC